MDLNQVELVVATNEDMHCPACGTAIGPENHANCAHILFTYAHGFFDSSHPEVAPLLQNLEDDEEHSSEHPLDRLIRKIDKPNRLFVTVHMTRNDPVTVGIDWF